MELEENQITALCLLAAGYQISVVAERTGVTRRTIERWKLQPEFKKTLREAMCRVYDSAIAELTLGAKEAALELKRIIHDSDVPAKVKITAINVLLTHTARAKDAVLEQRLEDMESVLDGNNTGETQSLGNES